MVTEQYSEISTNEEKFKTLLKMIHANLLKELGFKKDKFNFRLFLENGGVYSGYLINFQKSLYSDRSELLFTINIARKSSNVKIDEKFKEYDCNNPNDSKRLAILSSKYGFDKWWSITSSSDMTMIENDIVNLLKDCAFPWFGLNDN
ncbi:MAG: DUF4304 domain-containing protein [Clostridia bacterium]|nr:DUF4304 domain-containing protein [Clostridia bacterium]